MKRFTWLLCTIIFYGVGITLAIGQDNLPEAKMYIDEEGKLFWNKNLPVFLRIASSPDDKGVLLNSESHQEYVNPLYLDTEGVNYIRTRYAVDQNTKETISPKVEVLMEVYADGTPPVTIDFFKDAPQYFTDSIRYYGQNLSVTLSSEDNLSGVDEVYYMLNNQELQPFQDDMNFDQEGAYSLAFFGVDKVGNIEEKIERKFTVDLSAPTTFHNINGIAEDYIISLNSTIYLTAEDNLSGMARTYYRFDEEDFRAYDTRTLETEYLTDGEHVLHYYSEDQVGNKEEVKEFKFYFDKTAPITVADVLGDRYIANGNVYLSGRTKMKLTAVDNKAGVKEIRYSIDGRDFEAYDQPFYLPSISGSHVVRYYSIDNLSNQTEGKGGSGYEEFNHNVSKVYLDLTGPSIDYTYLGENFETRDTVFINTSTSIELKATDPESGLQYISYSLDGVSEETRYNKPFTLADAGLHTIEIFGYDNVNNRNKKSFYCLVDGEAPEIITNFSVAPIGNKDNLDIYPSYVILYLAATDQEVGANSIFYRINDEPEKKYRGVIDGFLKGKKYTITIRGVDLLGNEQERVIEFRTED